MSLCPCIVPHYILYVGFVQPTVPHRIHSELSEYVRMVLEPTPLISFTQSGQKECSIDNFPRRVFVYVSARIIDDLALLYLAPRHEPLRLVRSSLQVASDEIGGLVGKEGYT